MKPAATATRIRRRRVGTTLRCWPLFVLLLVGCDSRRTTSAAPTGSAASPPPSASVSAAPAGDLRARAASLARRTIIVDGHVDLPSRLFLGRDARGRAAEDVTRRIVGGDIDWVRAREGGLDAPFMSIFVPAKLQREGGARAMADAQIDLVEQLVRQAPDQVALARSPADVERNFAAGKLSLPLGIENGAALEGKLANLAHFYERGVRYLTLTHGEDNDLCDSSYARSRTNQGLSAFGRQVVAEMNRLGMMVDVSHLSDQAVAQVLDVSKAPVIASHSGCRRFTPGWERNLSDEQLARLGRMGSVVMINFGSAFLDEEVRQRHEARSQAATAYCRERGQAPGSASDEACRERYAEQHPVARATLSRLCDHIDHAVALAGIDHVGLGSDFDGVGDSLPTGLKDVSELPNLVRALLERGYREPDIAKILSGNILALWRTVERHALRQQLR